MARTHGLALEEFYPATMAGLTAPVRFLEWKMLKVASRGTPVGGSGDGKVYAMGHDWQPLTVEDAGWNGAKDTAARVIKGERWIYVFARPEGSFAAPHLVDELHLITKPGVDKQLITSFDKPTHTIHATKIGAGRYDGKAGPLPPVSLRGTDEVGDTIRFVRVYRGKRMMHYFFATRVQLSPQKIEALRAKVHLWVPPTHFEGFDKKKKDKTIGDADPNVLGGDGGPLFVPVLDPLTIAMNLHGAFATAADDLLEYVGYEGQDHYDRQKALKRQQKLLLARIVQMVLKDDPSRRKELKTANAVEDWIAEYDAAVMHRTKMRDLFATYLWNWLQSEPIEFLKNVHLELGEKEAMRFFVPIAMCISRGNETAPGRAGLAVIVENEGGKWDFIHDNVIPSSIVMKGGFKVGRKAVLGVLEAAAPLMAQIAITKGTVEAFSRMEQLRLRYGLDPFLLDGKPLPSSAHEAAKAFAASKTKVIKPPDAFVAQPLWRQRFTEIKSVIQAINMAIYVADMLGDPSFDKGAQVVGGALGTTKALLDFVNKPESALLKSLVKSKNGLGYVSGVIDLYVGVKGMLKAMETGESGVALGYFMVTVGGMLSSFAPLLLTASGPVAVVGLILAAVGYIFVYFMKKEPLNKFLEHSAWGPREGGGKLFDDISGMKGYEMIRGDYLGQLEVLLGLLCHFEFERRVTPERSEPAFHEAWLKTGWMPAGTTVTIGCEEHWKDAHVRRIEATFQMAEKKEPVATQRTPIKLTSQPDHGSHAYFLKVPPQTMRFPRDPDFEKMIYTGQLAFAFEGQTFRVPRTPLLFELHAGDEFARNKMPRKGR
jgi:hypothetical protein